MTHWKVATVPKEVNETENLFLKLRSWLWLFWKLWDFLALLLDKQTTIFERWNWKMITFIGPLLVQRYNETVESKLEMVDLIKKEGCFHLFNILHTLWICIFNTLIDYLKLMLRQDHSSAAYKLAIHSYIKTVRNIQRYLCHRQSHSQDSIANIQLFWEHKFFILI